MSMAADIASLELIAAVHQMPIMDQKAFDHLVHRLQQHVSHFEWVGLYLLERSGDPHYFLKAAAGDQVPESMARKAILQVEIPSSAEDVLGKLTVTSNTAVAFDESDYTSLAALVAEIGKKIEQSNENHQ
ncbi:hypothetical protein [Ammoniphilus resinae]|uniref:Methionine-R-sulfoxide reductase with GAF domain n=1 Tax=Ammoniphilus resinae TaxID=861532 RepID=A0ABS4GIU1_9BACL|nr:hypothetical protein [Ammoniphilus resinae]MBP1930174.1 putative methionine-R-sulfoxide reductase with GAF domain [Ammoniphilus resinae]